jgi:hypothetical protein
MLRDTSGGCTLVGQRDGDNRFLVDQHNKLSDGEFPPGTLDPADYRFHVELQAPSSGPKRQLRAVRREFELEVHDYPGSAFRDGAEDMHFQQLSEFLASCGGFMYLYDPTAKPRQNYEHFQETLLKLSTRAREQGRTNKNQVPQYMAVCITKYDDADVLSRLLQHQLIAIETINGVTTPSVSDAKEAFQVLAAENDRDLAPSIRDYFLDGHVAYFAVSSIGFYSKPGEPVRFEDCCNVVDTASGARIRGEFRPVNILAPLNWLQQKVIP